MPTFSERPSPEAARGTARSYVTGFGLALLLTAIPFALVAVRALDPRATLIVIAVLAIAQGAVHLHYFLHLDFSSSARNSLIALVFAALIAVLMIGGSLWIMFDLHDRMMM